MAASSTPPPPSGLLGTERYPAYCATKGAIVLLTKQMAIDYGPDIRVNCICPGATDTPRMRRNIANSPDPEGYYHRVSTLNRSMGRLARPEEIAYGVLFWPPTRPPSSPATPSSSTAARPSTPNRPIGRRPGTAHPGVQGRAPTGGLGRPPNLPPSLPPGLGDGGQSPGGAGARPCRGAGGCPPPQPPSFSPYAP